MRVNDKVLVENINDYFTHKGLSPNLIEDIKEKLKRISKNLKPKMKTILNIDENHQQK